MGQERRVRAGFQALGQRSRQRIHDDRRHHRARSPAQRRRPKKDGAQAIGRSRGGLTTKIHVLVDALGNPVEVILSPGQDHDLTCAESLIEAVDPALSSPTRPLTPTPSSPASPLERSRPSSHPNPTEKPRARATSPSTVNAISSSASSTSSNISGPSPRVTTSSPRFSSPAFRSLAPPSSSTEDRP